MLDHAESFSRAYPASVASVPRARAELTRFVTSAGIDPDRVQLVGLAASEALTNAVLHAYDQPGGTIELSASYVSGELWLSVTDRGAGLRVRSQSGGLGLGLALIGQLVDDFQLLSRATGGTELRMRFRFDPRGQTPSASCWSAAGLSASRPATRTPSRRTGRSGGWRRSSPTATSLSWWAEATGLAKVCARV